MEASPSQIEALRLVHHWSIGGTYMPYRAQQRSFEACEREGWLEYRTVESGSKYNGYALAVDGLRKLDISGGVS